MVNFSDVSQVDLEAGDTEYEVDKYIFKCQIFPLQDIALGWWCKHLLIQWSNFLMRCLLFAQLIFNYFCTEIENAASKEIMHYMIVLQGFLTKCCKWFEVHSDSWSYFVCAQKTSQDESDCLDGRSKGQKEQEEEMKKAKKRFNLVK